MPPPVPEMPPHVPHAVARAWQLYQRPRDAGTKGLTLHKVVQTAIALADTDGLPGVSIRKLSQQLGFTTMAVYRHVVSRDELVVVMADTALGRPPASLADAPTWQDALRQWGQALFARYAVHPWLLDVPVFGIPATPHHILWVETFLAAARATGLALAHQLEAALLIDGHARYIAQLGRLAAQPAAQEPGPLRAGWVRSLVERWTFPYFAAALAAGVLEDETGPSLTFGLDCIIAGLGAQPRE
jgi:AcrR family transcriptional regulator